MYNGDISVLAAVQLLTACIEIPSFFFNQKYRKRNDDSEYSLCQELDRFFKFHNEYRYDYMSDLSGIQKVIEERKTISIDTPKDTLLDLIIEL